MMFYYLQNLAQKLSDFLKPYFFLQKRQLATLKHCYYVFKHPEPMAFAKMLDCLSSARCLSDESIELLFNCEPQKSETLEICIQIIAESNGMPLTQEILTLLVHQYKRGLAYAMRYLAYEGWLNEGYVKLICYHQDPVDLVQGLKFLKDNDLLDGHDLLVEALSQHPKPRSLAHSFDYLNSDLLDRKDLINALSQHSEPLLLAGCFNKLRSWHFERGASNLIPKSDLDIDTDLLQKITNHPKPSKLSFALDTIGEHQRNRLILEKLAEHPEPNNLASAISVLSKVNVNEKILDLLAKHRHPLALARAMYPRENDSAQHFSVDYIGDEYIDHLVAHSAPYELAGLIRYLKMRNLATEENITRASQCSVSEIEGIQNILLCLPTDMQTQANLTLLLNGQHQTLFRVELANLIQRLKQLNLATEENITRASQYSASELTGLVYVLNCLPANMRTQANLSILLNQEHKILLTQDVIDNVWKPIRDEVLLLNQQIFNELVDITRRGRYAPMFLNVFYYYLTRHYLPYIWRALPQFTQQAVNALFPPHDADVRPLNQTQSTHRSSVHQSVSKSASTLKAQYGVRLDLQAVITRMKEDVNALPASLKNNAAKRCLERITSFDYIDQVSGVSILELLALAYQAIHDETKREGELADAMGLFVQGLYESQRGYNLNEAGEDNAQVDSPICTAGTFNKIIEKLVGIHPDVSINFITKELANLKFQSLAKQQALDYIKAHRSEVEREALSASIEPIWAKIKDEVAVLLWEEFNSIYASRTEFETLIENGQYIALSEEELNDAFAESLGLGMRL